MNPAIKYGTGAAAEAYAELDPDLKVELRMSPALVSGLSKLMDIFALSRRTVFNMAIYLALYEAERKGTSVNSLRAYPKRPIGKFASFQLTLDAKTRLEKAGRTDIDKVALCGLSLLIKKIL